MEAPTVEEKKDQISIKVVAQDGSEMYFKIKATTQFVKLMQAYCSRKEIAMSSVRFLFDSERVRPDQTPKELGMEEGDILDAVWEQVGGM
jgi:small ubiquitin-related modifier